MLVKGRVTVRKCDWDGNPIGHANDNPIFDTRSYIVDFDDGDQTELTVNMIAESLYLQCDLNGNQCVLLEEIVNHWRLPKSMKLSDQKNVHANGKTYQKCSTIGWQFCCQWKDSSTSWENFADLKESHPIEIAEYAKILGIDHEPAFNWWVPHVLRKRDHIISLVRKRNPCYLKRMHKFGIVLPKTVNEALELDKMKKSAHKHLLYLPLSYVLAKRVEYMEDTLVSVSSETCAPGGSYFGYSVFPGVMLVSSMHSPESLFQICNSFY